MANLSLQRIIRLSLSVVAVSMMVTGCGISKSAVNQPVSSSRQDGVAPMAESYADNIEKVAKTWIGTKYKYGGRSRSGVDCSGLVMEVYLEACGLKLPRTTRDMHAFCQGVGRSAMRKGDLVFFAGTGGAKKGKISHVGIYLGDDNMIHASSSRGVIISNINSGYYVKHYHSSRRVAFAGGFCEVAVEGRGIVSTVEDRGDEDVSESVDGAACEIDSVYSSMFD